MKYVQVIRPNKQFIKHFLQCWSGHVSCDLFFLAVFVSFSCIFFLSFFVANKGICSFIKRVPVVPSGSVLVLVLLHS